MNDKLDRLIQFIGQRGYVVIASKHPMKIGRIVTSWNMNHVPMNHPIKIESKTDADDFMDQVELVHGERYAWKYRFFYRCITD